MTATAAAANHDFLRGLGADEVIDYRMTDFTTAVHDAHAVLDTVGATTDRARWTSSPPALCG